MTTTAHVRRLVGKVNRLTGREALTIESADAAVADAAYVPVSEQVAWWVLRADPDSPVIGGAVDGPFTQAGAFRWAGQQSPPTTATPFYLTAAHLSAAQA